ncbi:MAG: SxtJ family membrane protein [Phormidesmis sp.]
MGINFSEIPKLDKQGLRKFGLTTGIIFAVLFGLVLPFVWGAGIHRWPIVAGGILCSVALVAPRSLAPFYAVWMRIALVLGWLNSRIILGIIFLLVLTPMALIMRLLGKDPMQRKLERDKASYRIPSTPPTEDSMTTPY